MTVQPMPDLNTPIGQVLKAAGSGGIVLESESRGRYALLPLDDDLIDLLIERSSSFCDRCRGIRGHMDSGQFHSHEDIRKQLLGE
jgi:hypothetical protein